MKLRHAPEGKLAEITVEVKRYSALTFLDRDAPFKEWTGGQNLFSSGTPIGLADQGNA